MCDTTHIPCYSPQERDDKPVIDDKDHHLEYGWDDEKRCRGDVYRA
uniref:Uncharacterized protein n=1 Tax=Arundo donax TaxID=35708 RepID=A0A0A9GH87_ARUDO